MIDPGSPLYIPPRLDLALCGWFWRFWRACNAQQMHHSMQTLAILGQASMKCWLEILVAEQIECGWRQGGWLDVFTTPAGQRRAEADAGIVSGCGFETLQLTGSQLRDREPAFAEEVRGAIAYPESAWLDPGRFLAGLQLALAGRGVAIRTVGDNHGPGSGIDWQAADATRFTPLPRPTTGSEQTDGARVTRLLVSGGRCFGVELATGERLEADRVVLAAGAWSARLAAGAGVRLPLQAGKGYHLELDSLDPPLRTASILTESYVAVTPLAGSLRLAGTLEFSGINHRLVPRRLDKLRQGALRCLPGVAEATVLSQWCGLRPCLADGLPVVGWAPGISGLFLATGHAKMGLTLGPITGKLVSESLLDGQTSLPIDSLSAHRF
jgi:D-amino-acid dehydrogenase